MHAQTQTPKPKRRRFAVTVDGVRHEVIVEELDLADAGGNFRVVPPPAAPQTPSAEPTGNPAPAADGPTHADGGLVDGWLTAPMPGTVTEISVNVGDEVRAGDVVVILTAMKLENEITAPASGKVAQIAVTAGDNVNSGERLIRLDTGGRPS